VGQEWKITSWEEGSRNEQDEDDDFDDEEEVFTPEDKKAAEAVLDKSILALENEDISTLSELWAADFEYENSEIEFTKDELLDKYQELFDGGRKHTKIILVNREYDFSDDEDDALEIYGLMTFSGVKSSGKEYTGRGFYAKFELEKINGSWMITEWAENVSSFTEEDDEDEDNDEDENDLDDGDAEEIIENAEELLEDMLESIENENSSALENYLGDEYEWIKGEETINKKEFISGISESFAEGRYYNEYYITNQQSEYISETEVKITGLFVIKGINGNGNYFEEIEKDEVSFTLKKRDGSWYVVLMEENKNQ
jgi:hypothetical protein